MDTVITFNTFTREGAEPTRLMMGLNSLPRCREKVVSINGSYRRDFLDEFLFTFENFQYSCSRLLVC
ncbi:hypothetical protein J6590_073739 [Homalodisca vitripennis]|nr:hypothetical protein J6590_073739 [Homalodisca vitripennis]